MKTISPNRINKTSYLILLIGAIWIVVSASLPGGASGKAIAAPQKGFLAPDFSLETLDGETIILSELRGNPILLNLWASWCGPCRLEMPAMERVYQEYKDEGFIILALNVTSQDSVSAAQNFVLEHGLTFPILLDHTGSVSQLYQLKAFPSSFFIDRDGIIQEVVLGGPMAEVLLRTRVERLLKEGE